MCTVYSVTDVPGCSPGYGRRGTGAEVLRDDMPASRLALQRHGDGAGECKAATCGVDELGAEARGDASEARGDRLCGVTSAYSVLMRVLGATPRSASRTEAALA